MDPCLQTSSIVINISSVTDPFYNYTATTLPYVSQQSAYSEFGTLIYETGYTSNGFGINQLLTTSGLWINDSGTNGPLLRSAIWTTIPTSASTHWFPLSTWIGYSYCITLLNEKTYYIGLAGDNGSMLRLNGQIVVKQDVSTVPQSNFKYWHIYPVTLNTGENIFEFFGYNQYDIAGFGFEVYDNTYNEITGATVIGDLNVIYSTIDQTGTTFHSALNDTLIQTVSGYTCNQGSSYTYQSCSGQCVQISAVTINTCSATTEIIQGVISEYKNKISPSITSIGYGYKSYNGLISNQKALIFTTSSVMSFPDIPFSDVIPPIIEHSGVTFLTDVVFRVFQSSYVVPYSYVVCADDPQPADPKQWGPILKGGAAFNIYYPVDPNFNIFLLGGTIGFVAVDNIDNTIVGVTCTHCLTKNPFFTSERNPLDLIENVDNHKVYGDVNNSYNPQPFGCVKRYQPMSLTNSTNNVDAGLISFSESSFDPLSSWEQIGISSVTSPPEFATTQELDDLLNLNPPVFSVGRTTGVKGEYDKKLIIFETNVTVFVGPFRNQTSYQLVTFDDCFVIIQSAATTPQGYVCKNPFYFGDSGSAILAEINGSVKIIGISFALAVDVLSNDLQTALAGVALRIDRVSQILNISAYTGQTINFSNLDEIETECLPGLSSETCIELSGETYCQIGMCYPSIPSSAKYIRSCYDPSFGFDVDFLTFNVNDGEVYRLKFIDYIAHFRNECWEVISASTVPPGVIVSTIEFGPFINCNECENACFVFDIIIDQNWLDDSTGNTNSSLDGKVFVEYFDCVVDSIIEKTYTVAGTYSSDICGSIITPGPELFYWKNNIRYLPTPGAINTFVSCT
jgi:hypothetical protein